MKKFDELRSPLKPHEVDVRVGQVGAKGVNLLLYKTARTDARRLDEVFPGQWKREHYIDSKGSVVCQISVWNSEINNWVIREDVGSESDFDASKGAYSDAFKRAGFSFGIGAELYDAPFIFVKTPTVPNSGARGYKLNDPYFFNDVEVTAISYSDAHMQVEISKRGKGVIYTNFGRVAPSPTATPAATPTASGDVLRACKTLEELKTAWLNLGNADRAKLIDVKEEVKNKLTEKPKDTDPWANL